jgi:hypothetical protein
VLPGITQLELLIEKLYALGSNHFGRLIIIDLEHMPRIIG